MGIIGLLLLLLLLLFPKLPKLFNGLSDCVGVGVVATISPSNKKPDHCGRAFLVYGCSAEIILRGLRYQER